MPQSARATFKLGQHLVEVGPENCFNASIGTSNLQALSSRGIRLISVRFNASIGTSQLQAVDRMVGSKPQRRFNASIGTSNLQAPYAARPHGPRCMVSMPQSARATFKLIARASGLRSARC